MTRIGLIGAGKIGTALAGLARGSGHHVVFSNSRGPHTLTGLAARIGTHVKAGTVREAAAADIVVLTIPLHRLPSLAAEARPHLSDRVVIDTMNYYPDRDGRIADLDEHRRTTSELTAEALPGARIVKAFNNIAHPHLASLARPKGSPDRSVLPIASDDAAAKQEATALIDDLGYDVLDTGSLREGWRFENGQPAYCLPYAADPTAFMSSAPGNRPLETGTVRAADLKTALGQASRR